ncbi:MAG: type III glutamate--ammonia ligase, partial [Pseudomonadota bacterium]|nr:type III glutamate--ammonia ligase [Pseudomonadota bacterium]
MPTNLSQVATERGIKYFLISFVDLFGSLRSKLVPARAIADMQKDGAGFAGFAAWLDMTPADSDMFSIPDPDSLIQLPWKPEVGWLAGDLAMDGKPVEASPRVALKHQIARAEKLGFRMKTGVECEYFLVSADGSSISDPNDTQEKPCYDQSALMRQYDVISEICDSMIELGWGPYQNDHEDANGQFEMNWDYDDALVTADRHVFFKYMVKAITEKHGLRATFMPKPFSNLTGNGCHAHVSVWDKTGQNNLFEDSSD